MNKHSRQANNNDELRNTVEDSVRHARANVGFTLNSHQAAEQNISMNVETIMVAAYRYAQKMVVAELRSHRDRRCICAESGVQACDSLWHHNNNIEDRITNIEKELEG